jgi:hypothetical protein
MCKGLSIKSSKVVILSEAKDLFLDYTQDSSPLRRIRMTFYRNNFLDRPLQTKLK